MSANVNAAEFCRVTTGLWPGGVEFGILEKNNTSLYGLEPQNLQDYGQQINWTT